MGPRRLITFGLFEFSLAVFAVIGGLFQYADTFMGIELWDADLWQGWIESQQGWVSGLGAMAQVVSAIAGLAALLVIGFATGLVRTFLRDWGFALEKTARGFRRRRGLFTKTDVVMPVHRVQALVLGTGWLRYRFGWHDLKFVSLAKDAGSSSHVVAPFAQMEEIDPIIRAANFTPPSGDLDWRHASRNYRFDSAAIEGGFFALLAIPVAAFAPAPFVLIPLTLAAFFAAANLYAWQFHRHALSRTQLFGRRGLLSPSTKIASRVKLHSVEIAQGPIAQRRGYSTLHLGLAGGTFAIPGLPIERAQELRSAILESIAATDFSQLN
jgi:putative membrane protein